MKQWPVISIVGVPNTGKSTLFNRLVGSKKALVHSKPAMTRDVFRHEFEIDDNIYYLQDTGGFFIQNDVISKEVIKKIYHEVENSALIIFLFDGKREILGYEKDFYLQTKKLNKKIIVVLNKMDSMEIEKIPTSYYSLKVDLIPISAEHNLGIELITEQIPKKIAGGQRKAIAEKKIRLAIIGKPNVGKSALANKILQDERVIVSPIPGTTRDSIDLEFHRNGQLFVLIDNAGIRKLQKVKEETESAAIIRAQKNIQFADMVLFVIDLSSRIDQNDLMIGQIVAQSTKPTIIVANKWDLVQEKQPDMLSKEIKERFNKLFFAPVIFCSAITGKGVFQIIDRAAAIFSKTNKKIRIAHLNQILKSILKEKKFFSIEKKIFRPKYVTLETQLPLFLRFYAKEPSRIKPDDEFFLKKRILQELELEGVPVFFKIIPYKKK